MQGTRGQGQGLRDLGTKGQGLRDEGLRDLGTIAPANKQYCQRIVILNDRGPRRQVFRRWGGGVKELRFIFDSVHLPDQ